MIWYMAATYLFFGIVLAEACNNSARKTNGVPLSLNAYMQVVLLWPFWLIWAATNGD